MLEPPGFSSINKTRAGSSSILGSRVPEDPFNYRKTGPSPELDWDGSDGDDTEDMDDTRSVTDSEDDLFDMEPDTNTAVDVEKLGM